MDRSIRGDDGKFQGSKAGDMESRVAHLSGGRRKLSPAREEHIQRLAKRAGEFASDPPLPPPAFEELAAARRYHDPKASDIDVGNELHDLRKKYEREKARDPEEKRKEAHEKTEKEERSKAEEEQAAIDEGLISEVPSAALDHAESVRDSAVEAIEGAREKLNASQDEAISALDRAQSHLPESHRDGLLEDLDEHPADLFTATDQDLHGLTDGKAPHKFEDPQTDSKTPSTRPGQKGRSEEVAKFGRDKRASFAEAQTAWEKLHGDQVAALETVTQHSRDVEKAAKRAQKEVEKIDPEDLVHRDIVKRNEERPEDQADDTPEYDRALSAAESAADFAGVRAEELWGDHDDAISGLKHSIRTTEKVVRALADVTGRAAAIVPYKKKKTA